MSDLNKLPQPGAPCLPPLTTDPQGKDAFILRFGTATKEAVPTGTPPHTTDTDPAHFPDGLGTYSKALKQTSPGTRAPSFDAFLKVCGVKPGGPVGDFEAPGIVLGGTEKLNGPRGAFALQPVGKDSAGFGDPLVPPAPALNSLAYAIELVELYWASLLRDVPFSEYVTNATAQAAANELSALAAAHPGQYAGPLDASGKVTPHLLFRGGLNAHPTWFAGETVGPYLSQLCVTPTSMGRVPIDQKIQTLKPGHRLHDRTTHVVRHSERRGARRDRNYDTPTRYMRTGRDTAAYTQVDQLYQAYLIAYLVCGASNIPPNPESPYLTYAHDKAFGTFGGPDITATIGAVAKAAINAVWYQKWKSTSVIALRRAEKSCNS